MSSRATVIRFALRAGMLLAFVCAGSWSVVAQEQKAAVPEWVRGEVQYLWPEGAPGAAGGEEQDRPKLEVFAVSGKEAHTAVIVCPGGGYTHLAYEKEGVRIAEWLNLRGVTAFVLTYRLAPRYKYPAPQEDGKRAVRWVRAHAAEYHIHPNRIGMWGFSAGGHLVGMVATHFDAGKADAADPVERVSDRPDFVISAYGLLAMDGEEARRESLSNFTDRPVTPELIKELSPANHVTPQTPPFFLFATTDDQRVPVMASVAFYVAMLRSGAPVEMHLYEHGPHGVGLAMGDSVLSGWTTPLEIWLRKHGWIEPALSASVR